MKIVNINDRMPIIFEHNMALYVMVEAEITDEIGLTESIKTSIKISDDFTLSFEKAIALAIDALNTYREQKEAE